MERKFKTLIKEEHKFGKNEFVQGNISGFQHVICDGERNGIDKPGIPMGVIPGTGIVLVTICEPEQYTQFSDLVEKHYPGLCIFDWVDTTKEEAP